MNSAEVKKFLKKIATITALTLSLTAASTGTISKEQDKVIRQHVSKEFSIKHGKDSFTLVRNKLHDKEELLRKIQESLSYSQKLLEQLTKDYTGNTARKLEDELIGLDDYFRDLQKDTGLELRQEIMELDMIRRSIIKKRDEMKQVHQKIEDKVEDERKKKEKKEKDQLKKLIKFQITWLKKKVSNLKHTGSEEDIEQVKEGLDTFEKNLKRLESFGEKIKSQRKSLEKMQKEFERLTTR